MKILALEFSSPQRSVAVVTGTADGRADAYEVVETGTGAMAPIGMIDRALREAGLEREQIECVAVGLGPGSYTGIRAAIALAQGWQLARGVKLIGVSSADAIAARAHANGLRGRGVVVIDAQRDELYLAEYEMDAQWRGLSNLRLASLEEARAHEKNGATLIGPEVKNWFPAGMTVFPGAEYIGRLALTQSEFVPGEKLEPIYLREAKFVKAPPSRVFS